MSEQIVKKNPHAICAGKVKSMLEKNRDAIMKSLPRGFDNYDRMTRTVINAISTTPAVAECSPESIFLSTVKSFSMGLEPNGALGEAYLVPFRNNKKNCMEAQFMPGYRGLISIARRSGQISQIYAKEVYEKDEIIIEEGTERKIVHNPKYFGDRGNVIGYYAVFKLKDGGFDFEVMDKQAIDRIRARSKAGKSNYSPWATDYDEMAKKTVIKRLLKRAPMSIDMAMAVEDENKASMGEEQDSDIIDVMGITVEESPLEQPVEEK